MKKYLLILIALFLQGCSENGKVTDKGEGNKVDPEPISVTETVETEEDDVEESITIQEGVYHWQGDYDIGFTVKENINLDKDEFVETLEIWGGKPEGDSTVPQDFYIKIIDEDKSVVLPHLSESGSPHVYAMDMNKDGNYEFVTSDSYRTPSSSDIYTYNGEDIILVADSLIGEIMSVENGKVLLDTGVEFSFNGKNLVNQNGKIIERTEYASEEDYVLEDEDAAVESDESDKEVSEVSAKENLGGSSNQTIFMNIEPEEFAGIFNKIYKKVYQDLTPTLQKTVGKETRIPQTLIEEYEWNDNSFTYYFNQDLGITGLINPNGTISSIGLLKELPEKISLDKNEELLLVSAQHILAQKALILSISEATTNQDVEQIFKELTEEYKQAKDEPTVIHEGIKYIDIVNQEDPTRHFNLFLILLEEE
ncbi:hypothetical protein [Bacillus sp. EB01]|uniref:hypothetical protein n=1 Tax=Bacillus sp. EB01 TaxID=1347086 RepID=UPI0005C7266C|nr:hypothetical protein [Bacillus sp. EB01]